MQTFTDRYIKSLKPKGKDYIVRESTAYGEGGFAIRIRPSGFKTWIMIYTYNGKRKWLSLGHYPSMGLSDARKRFRAAKDLLELGVDPGAWNDIHERASNERITVNRLCELYLMQYAKIEKKQSSAKQDELNLARDLQKAIGSRSVEEVTRNDLQKIISGIVDRGAYVQAQRTRSTIRKMFRWAEQEQIIKENPALTLSPLKNRQSKTRVLSLEEILVLWANIDSEKRLPKVIGIILKIILLTGVRPGEAIKIYKKYAGASWVLLDSRETKNKNPHRVYLSSLAKGLFESIDDDSTLSSDPKYKIENYTLSSWIRRLNYLGLEKWSPHDLRRSCATMLAQQGTELHIIKKVLNHSDSDITSSVYVIYMYDEQIKSALDILSEKIKENLHA